MRETPRAAWVDAGPSTSYGRFVDMDEIARRVAKGEIEEIREPEWAKDAEGVARPVGTVVTGYKFSR